MHFSSMFILAWHEHALKRLDDPPCAVSCGHCCPFSFYILERKEKKTEGKTKRHSFFELQASVETDNGDLTIATVELKGSARSSGSRASLASPWLIWPW